MDRESLEKAYESFQVWPFGHGTLAVGHGVHEGQGLVIASAVPDAMQRADWHDDPARGAPTWDELREAGAPFVVLAFKDRAAIDRLIENLLTLKGEMP